MNGADFHFAHEPVREIKGCFHKTPDSQKSGFLSSQPTIGAGDSNVLNVAPLQLGEEVVELHRLGSSFGASEATRRAVATALWAVPISV
jgi:hypothetical protein